MQTVGILAVQGAFVKHKQMLDVLNCKTKLVKTVEDLSSVDRLVIPGGESTAMRIMLKKHNMWDSLREFCCTNPVLGTCAGAILLSSKIDDGVDESLYSMDIDVTRNSYGRQIESFITQVPFDNGEIVENISANFIRAPQIVRVGHNVKVLSSLNGQVILAQDKLAIACTFHPELTDDLSIHRYFIHI